VQSSINNVERLTLNPIQNSAPEEDSRQFSSFRPNTSIWFGCNTHAIASMPLMVSLTGDGALLFKFFKVKGAASCYEALRIPNQLS
jgi:hypothetical protein